MIFAASSGLSRHSQRNEQEERMGRVVVTEFVTLDGVFEDPGGAESFEHGGWSFKFDRGPEGDRFKLDELMAAEAQLLGRVTYAGFAKAWPSMEAGEFGKKMNGMPKYVVSSTLAPADATWENSTVIAEDVAGEVSRLKERLTGDLLVAGSATLVGTLAAEDLVDEYRLMVFPIVLGSGRRLFGDGFPHTTLRLVESKTTGADGVLILTYRPARS
jgi:dihydrofolate reductase